jgi:hypothetical protein
MREAQGLSPAGQMQPGRAGSNAATLRG